jgi:predicted MFS family arabinose efflux permease
VNRAELEHIRGVDDQGKLNEINIAKKPKVPWSFLLRSSNMWAIMLAYFTYVYSTWIFFTWLPSYLVEHRGFTLVKMGIFASLPLLSGAVGNTVGGWLTDYLLKKTKRTAFSRRVVAVSGMLGGMVFIMPAALTSDPYIAVFCLCVAFFSLECTIGPSWTVPMDVGNEYSGTVSGLMNTAGQAGGAISSTVFGLLVYYFSWEAPFMIAAAMCLIGACTWAFWLNPEVSVIHKDMIIGSAQKTPATATT